MMAGALGAAAGAMYVHGAHGKKHKGFKASALSLPPAACHAGASGAAAGRSLCWRGEGMQCAVVLVRPIRKAGWLAVRVAIAGSGA